MERNSVPGLLIMLVFCGGSPRAVGAETTAGGSEALDRGMELVRQLESAMNGRDAAAASALLDVDVLIDRTMAGLVTSPEYRDRLRKTSAGGASEFMTGVIKALGQNGSYHFLRLRHVNGETRALFRVLSKDGDLNYHDWVTGMDRQGRRRLDDVYISGAGELASQTVRRVVVAMDGAEPPWLDQVGGTDAARAATVKAMKQVIDDARIGKFEDALREYKVLPPALREDKSFMLLRVRLAQKLKAKQPGEYDAAIADFQRLFPGDPCLDLTSLDALLAAGQYRETLQSLDRIEAFVGTDAFLYYLRGRIYLKEGGSENLERARKLYRTAIDIEPTLHTPYWGLVTLSLKTKNFDETAACLDEIERKFRLRIKDLTTIPAYADFVKSDAYRKWKASRQSDPKPSP